MARVYSHFSDLKTSGAGKMPTPKLGAKTGPAAPTWSAGSTAAAPKWTPGDKEARGWPKGFYVQHEGVANTKHEKHGQAKVEKVMHEFKKGTLKSSSGAKVTNRKQAVAVAMSEAGLSRKKK